MEDDLIALISMIVEGLDGVGSFLFYTGSPISDWVFEPNVALAVGCLVVGYGSGWLSTLMVTHALLPKAWMRVGTLIALPPVTGYATSRTLEPGQRSDIWLFSRSFWLPVWLMLGCCAGRLVHIIR